MTDKIKYYDVTIGNAKFNAYQREFRMLGHDITMDLMIKCPVCEKYFRNEKGIMVHLNRHTTNSDIEHARLYFKTNPNLKRKTKQQFIDIIKARHENSVSMLNELSNEVIECKM